MKKILLPLFAWVAGTTISLLAQPVITTQPTNQIVLKDSNALFYVAANGSGWLTYQWQHNGTNLPKLMVTTIAGGGTGGDGSMATGAVLSYPSGVTADNTGNIYIAEGGNNRIRKVDTNGIISTVAGNGSAGYGGDGGLATNASLNSPFQVAVDGVGNLYIADYVNNRIRKVDTNGVISTLAGNGVAGYSGDGTQATNASLYFPSGMTLDGMGNLYIADSWNNRIRKVDASGVITTVAGNGSGDYTGDGGLATSASLNYPTAEAFDDAGNLYIDDYGNDRIRKVDLNGIITTVAGNGQLYAGGDGGAATNASLVDVYAVVDDLGNLLFADSYANSVRQVDTNGIVTSLVMGFNQPSSLFVDLFDNLYVADSQNNRIEKVALLGSPILNLYQVTTNNAGNYDVIISDADGSVTSSVINMTVNVPAFIATQPQSQSVSVASNVTFNVSAGGTWPLTFQWLSNGATINGETNASYTFNVASTNLAGGYSVVITNNYGSITSSVATLTVLVLPPGIASQPGSQTVQSGSNALFTVVASGSPPFNYQWFFNSTPLDGQTNASLSLPNATTNQAGAYSISINSPYGSITSHIATLTVGWLPSITMQPTNQSVLAGNRALLTAGVSGVGSLTFQWQLNGTNLPNNLIATIAGSGTAGFAGDGGIAATGKIYQPYGVAADGFGNVFIADSGNNRIRKVSTNGVMITVAGTGIPSFSGDGGAATNARIYSPEGVALDASGNLYIADTGNNRIRKVDTNGIITTVVGNGGGGFFGDGGAATNAHLYNPYGITCDGSGNLYIADALNTRIRKVDTNGIITTVAGKSSSTFSGDGGAATNAGVSAYGVAVDAGGNLFIADRSNNRVRRVDAYGFITTIAGTGSPTFSGDGGVATNAGMTAYGVAVDDYGDVYIADHGNNRIRRVDPYGIITTVAGTNGFGYSSDGIPATNALLNAPTGIALDSFGRFLIADAGNNRIRRFGQGPTLVLDSVNATNAGNYILVVSSSFGSVTSAVVTLTVLLPPTITSQPVGQSIGLGSNATFNVMAAGTLPLAYSWQTNGVNLSAQTNQSLNLTNVQWSDAGNYQVVITNNYGSVTSAVATLTVGVPPSIISQPSNQIVLLGSNTVLSVQVAGDGLFTYQWQFKGTNLPPIITTVAGTGKTGNPSLATDGGPATNAFLNNPVGVAVDRAGNIFIADNAIYRVRKVDTNGIIHTFAGNGSSGYTGNGGYATNATLGPLQALALDITGNLYIADYGEVRKVDTNGVITRVAGTGAGGFSFDGGAATNTVLFGATGVVVDSQGNVFIDDYYSYRIRKVGTNGIITTVAGITAGGVVSGFSGDGGKATNANLSKPYGVAVDAAGNIYISDSDNLRVRKVDTNGIINTIVGGGSSSSDGLQGTNTLLRSNPFGLALDFSNNLFIATGTVRKMDTNGIMTTVAGGGSFNPNNPGDYGSATNALLWNPRGLAFDALGNLYIADPSGFRVRKVHFSGDPTLQLLNTSATNSGNYSVVITSPFGSVASSVATLMVLVPPQQFTGQFANGGLQIQFSGTPNYPYILQSATNLTPPVNWQPALTNPADGNGNWQFTDTNLNESQKFYRAVGQ